MSKKQGRLLRRFLIIVGGGILAGFVGIYLYDFYRLFLSKGLAYTAWALSVGILSGLFPVKEMLKKYGA